MQRSKTILMTSILAVAALLLAAPWASSQPPAQPAGQEASAAAGGRGGGGFGRRGATPIVYEDNEGWLSLFNGEDLSGWSGDMRYWSVNDGAIYIESTCERPSGTIYLVWDGGEPADFALKFEFKGTGSINGGMQYRSYLTADSNVGLKYPGRGGGGTPGLAAGAEPPAARGGGARGGRGGGGGRGAACENPGEPPSVEERAPYDMAGPQFDFDAGNRYPGQYYEQAGRGIVVSPGQAVLADENGTTLLATIADTDTLNSWFKQDDYNQFLLVAKGNTHSMYMNGHLVSVLIDDNSGYFRPSGKIGIEVESRGELFTRNIYLKRL